MRFSLAAAFLALALAGCAESQFGGSMFYLKPYNIENLSCDELKKLADAQAGVIQQKSDLREKAATGVVGASIGASVYGPDQNAARWKQRQYQEEAARKNCAAQPPPAPAPPPSPPPAPPK